MMYSCGPRQVLNGLTMSNVRACPDSASTSVSMPLLTMRVVPAEPTNMPVKLPTVKPSYADAWLLYMTHQVNKISRSRSPSAPLHLDPAFLSCPWLSAHLRFPSISS